MADRIYFSDLAAQFGIPGGAPQAGPGARPPAGPPGEAPHGALPQGGPGAPGGPGGMPMVHPNVWRKEGGEKLLSWLGAHYRPGDVFEYDGHADCWLMLAVMHQLRDCQIQTYIGVFDRTLPITAYQTGPVPAEGQPCTFTVEEQGDQILLTVHLDPEKGPFDMPFGDIVAPELPSGKDIYVRLDGRHLLFTFPVSLTYGKTCRSMIVDYSGECFCAVSNTPDVSVGDQVDNPFKR